jgi:Ni/Co efflux regulator RcnB
MTIRKILTVSALCVTLLGPAALAQYHDDHHDDHHDDRGGPPPPPPHGGYVRHDDWRSGHRMAQGDWGRAQRIDYNRYHLPPPRRGYEWRQVDGNYVMAAVATGLIASVVVASTIH